MGKINTFDDMDGDELYVLMNKYNTSSDGESLSEKPGKMNGRATRRSRKATEDKQ